MKTKIILSAAMLLFLGGTSLAQAPAFPGAEGNGRYVTGGRGGKIIHVTNLNDSGEGSFREAVSSDSKKIVVFDVAGVIPLKSELKIGQNTTIEGQTAPFPGITLRYYTVRPNSNNIIRFIRFRRGEERDTNDGADCIWQRHVSGLILDHCSMSWSTDELGSFYDNNNFTMQWCMLGEGLNSGHSKGAHSYGGIWGGKLASFHHNFLGFIQNRAPRFCGARYNWSTYKSNTEYGKYNWQNSVQAENVDFRNCVMYNWGNGNGCYGGPGGGYINIVNNYYKAGPGTSNKTRVTQVSVASNGNSKGNDWCFGMTSRYFINGNYVTAAGSNAKNYDWNGVIYDGSTYTINGEKYSLDSARYYAQGNDTIAYEKVPVQVNPHRDGRKTVYDTAYYDAVKIKLDGPGAPAGDVTTHSAENAYDKVLAYAGASLYRDAVDTGFVYQAKTGTTQFSGSIQTKTKGIIDVSTDDKNCYSEDTPGWGLTKTTVVDSDGDGMPDDWEKANGLNPNDASDANLYTIDKAKQWYTNVEVYCNSLVEDIVKSENANAETAVNEYYPTIAGSKSDSTQIKEQKIFTSTFTDWADAKANNSAATTVSKKTLYSDENLTFTVFDTQISSTNQNTGKFPDWEGGYLMAAKSADPYIETSPLKNITKVHFLHGATGSKRGWKLEVKGDGDEDWVTVSDAVANPSSGADVTVDVNRTNCQLRFTNLNASQNAYLFQLDIYGKVDMTGKDAPEFNVNYYNVDGSVITTQKVKQDETIGSLNDGSEVTVPEGSKFRGWLTSAKGRQKITADAVVTDNINLYPLVTDIEGDEPEERNVYNLKDKYFYVEDHEGFVPTSSYSYNGAQHGLDIKAGSVKLKVGGNAIVIIESCQYSKSYVVLKDGNGKVVGDTVKVPSVDGTKTTLRYTGPATTLTLDFPEGEIYLHSLSVITTGTYNIAKNDEGYYVAEAGNGNSFLNILDVIAANEDGKSRVKIFLPDGTYNLGENVETTFPVDNISVIGQSKDNTIIVTAPDKSIEGLGSADMFYNNRQNIYFQDVTLKNALDYYAAGSAGRAAVIQDRGNRTIYKNVRMLSYQDTYYSQNSNMQSYFNDCDVHGTVDFICGGGDVRFDSTTITLEPRNANGGGGRTITAPTTTTNFGYVFDNCKVVDLGKGGNWNYGRTWQNNPVCVWLNTTLDNAAEKSIVSKRWTEKGMNNRDPKVFGEYATKDENGTDITPASNKISSYGGDIETILTADEAAAYSYEKMFTDWNPKALSAQLSVTGLTLKDGTLNWTATEGATAYAIFKDGVFQTITTATTYAGTSESNEWSVRAANGMGGFGPVSKVGVISSISNLEMKDNEAPVSTECYNLSGMHLSKQSPLQPEIIKMTMKDGSVKAKKVIRK